MRVSAETIRSQLETVLRAWGMSDVHARTTAEMMVETDLRRVDSHGISMLLHATRPADPEQRVMVAGDPGILTRAERLEQGVPIPDDLMEQLRAVASRASVPFLLA